VTVSLSGFAQDTDPLETMLSRSHYFDWINSQYEGTTEAQTLINMDFFQWLHDEYGMVLEVYSLDVGNIDDGPYTAGVGRLIPYHYGTMESEEFRKQFPNGFAPLVEKAAGFGGRLAVWMGPDGFGVTPEEEKARTDMLISLCRDHNFIAFKVDAVAGQLRPQKQSVFRAAIDSCRVYTPDLMILDHRVKFGEAQPVVTTSLWEGVETYIDVFMPNSITAIHHRAGALSRERTPGLTRRLEDHGVCLSSCLDYWDDELILQAFNRSLLLSPSIYGNPWLLRDDEFSKLARIYNLHRQHNELLTEGMALPEAVFGPHAMSRGDDLTRFITLRNLTWEEKTIRLTIDESIGLDTKRDVEVRRFHPSERMIGRYARGSRIPVKVEPFRSCLIMVSARPVEELGVTGCDYEVIRDVPGKPAKLKLLGRPGQRVKVRLAPGKGRFSKARLEGQECDILDKAVYVEFPGKKIRGDHHRPIGTLRSCTVPDDAEALYEAACFAADNNALEVRELQRSGPSAIPQVTAAREAFFRKPMFVNRGIWDRNLFDADIETSFIARLDKKALRIDLGEVTEFDKLVFRIRDRQSHNLNPDLYVFDVDASVEVSPDLKQWVEIRLGHRGKGTIAWAKCPSGLPVRYVRVHGAPQVIAEVEAYRDGKKLDRTGWRASNLFASYKEKPAGNAMHMTGHIRPFHRTGKLAVAVNGSHGKESLWAAMRIDGGYVGANDRAVSYPSNTWEYYNVDADNNTTFFFPLSASMVGKTFEVVLLDLGSGTQAYRAETWITTGPVPYETRELILYE
jgi:hypothetical protein